MIQDNTWCVDASQPLMQMRVRAYFSALGPPGPPFLNAEGYILGGECCVLYPLAFKGVLQEFS